MYITADCTWQKQNGYHMSNRLYKHGVNREQSTFLPPRVEDYIDKNNAVRAIEAYVNSLNLEDLGFTNCGNISGRGQPAFPPAMHLKLFIWGYLNRIRATRRLENEIHRNLELIWLLQSLKPGFRVIADFRSKNAEALCKVQRNFTLLCKRLGLFGGQLVAIDSVNLEGSASKNSVLTKGKLKKMVDEIDADVKQYLLDIDYNDSVAPVLAPDEMQIADKIAQFDEQREILERLLNDIEKSGKRQLSRTDPDARYLSKSTDKGPTVGYQIQAAVDSKNKLIAVCEVTVDKTDSESLMDIVKAAKEILDVKALGVTVDSGYYSNENVAECEQENIELFMPVPDKGKAKRSKGFFERNDFIYDSESDSYTCPGEQIMTRKGTQKKDGKINFCYYGKKTICSACKCKDRCIEGKTKLRVIYRSEHEDAVDRHRARMEDRGPEMMRKRSGLAEHPFGTIKVWLGWTHFLIRGARKVKGEMALITTCYNFKRTLNIIGLEKFIAACSA
jgi:transposase